MRQLAWVLAVAVLPASAAAVPPAGRLAVVGFGRCDEPLLADATRSLRQLLSRLAAERVLDDAATAAPGGGLAGSSPEEIRRALDAGRAEFLNLDPARAERTFTRALAETDRLPLGPRRWDLSVEARASLAGLWRQAGRDAADAFLDIVRVKEEFALDRAQFPPSTHALVAQAKRLVAAQPRHRLSVASEPAGATVWLNGYPVGRTPFARHLPAGRYELVVGEPAERSLARRLAFDGDVEVSVDLARETAFRPDHGPCFEAAPRRELRLAAASTLSAALGVEELVAVRIVRVDGEEAVAAALVQGSSGREVREGRMRTAQGGLPPLERLAKFALTGEGMPDEAPAPTEAKPEAAVAAAAKAEAPLAVTLPAPETGQSRREARSWKRTGGWVLAAAAVVLGTAAVVGHLRLEDRRQALEALVVPESGGSVAPGDASRALELQSDIDGAGQLRLGTGLGGAAAAVGAGILFLAAPASPAVEAGQPADGLGFAIAGRF